MLKKSFYCWGVVGQSGFQILSRIGKRISGVTSPDGVTSGSKSMQVFASRGGFQLFSVAAGSLVSEGRWQELKP